VASCAVYTAIGTRYPRRCDMATSPTPTPRRLTPTRSDVNRGPNLHDLIVNLSEPNLHRPRQGPHAEVTYIMLITTFTNSDSASY